MADINYYDPDKQFSTSERCDINELLNCSDDENCSIARASIAVGVCTQLHAVKHTIERYVILDGQGKVYVNKSSPKNVSHLDVVTIPPGVPQKIENCGETELVFLCICTPRFQQKNYLCLETESISDNRDELT